MQAAKRTKQPSFGGVRKMDVATLQNTGLSVQGISSPWNYRIPLTLPKKKTHKHATTARHLNWLRSCSAPNPLSLAPPILLASHRGRRVGVSTSEPRSRTPRASRVGTEPEGSLLVLVTSRCGIFGILQIRNHSE